MRHIHNYVYNHGLFLFCLRFSTHSLIPYPSCKSLVKVHGEQTDAIYLLCVVILYFFFNSTKMLLYWQLIPVYVLWSPSLYKSLHFFSVLLKYNVLSCFQYFLIHFSFFFPYKFQYSYLLSFIINHVSFSLIKYNIVICCF